MQAPALLCLFSWAQHPVKIPCLCLILPNALLHVLPYPSLLSAPAHSLDLVQLYLMFASGDWHCFSLSLKTGILCFLSSRTARLHPKSNLLCPPSHSPFLLFLGFHRIYWYYIFYCFWILFIVSHYIKGKTLSNSWLTCFTLYISWMAECSLC